MTKPKTRADLVRSLELDWPPRQPMTITDLERIPVMFEHSRHGERIFCILAG